MFIYNKFYLPQILSFAYKVLRIS